MLVLGRRVGEEIKITHMGETLTVVFVSGGTNRCRLGIRGSETFKVERHDMKSDKPSVEASTPSE